MIFPRQEESPILQWELVSFKNVVLATQIVLESWIRAAVGSFCFQDSRLPTGADVQTFASLNVWVLLRRAFPESR